ncbi:hypothetical protein [Desulfonema magnum]|uniref:Uncharacterized protein n=1 Tax=Desulfonema magnum TaxID=45655 RepID=A0A975BIW4_9BACT|nr:hypothetical protein [Desulfonema magnum]QTA85930.1 Uncharacterized protein dnm_019470 [Desulfonema magnum]
MRIFDLIFMFRCKIIRSAKLAVWQKSPGLADIGEIAKLQVWHSGATDIFFVFLVPMVCVTAIKLRLIRGGKKSFRQGCEK